MLCQNCKKNKANVKYTQVINGNKKQMMLCDECSKLLGIEVFDFDNQINFSNLLGDFINYCNLDFTPIIAKTREVKNDNSNMIYDDFTNIGRFSYSNYYDVFENEMDSLFKEIQCTDKDEKKENNNFLKKNVPQYKEKVKKNSKEELEKELQKAVKEERYEDAAKIRDEIKKQERR